MLAWFYNWLFEYFKIDPTKIPDHWCKIWFWGTILFAIAGCGGILVYLFSQFPLFMKLYFAFSYLWIGGAGWRTWQDFAYFLLAPVWIFLVIIMLVTGICPSIM